jgi:hypothetical protein
MFDILIRLATWGFYLALGVFICGMVLSLFSKRAKHFLNCGNHTMKVCQGKQVFLVCYDCGLRVSKGWNLETPNTDPGHVHSAGRRPDGLRLLLDTPWPGEGLRGPDAGYPGGEVA